MSEQRRMLSAMVGQWRRLVPKNHTGEDSGSEEWELHSSRGRGGSRRLGKREMELEPFHQWVQRVTKLARAAASREDRCGCRRSRSGAARIAIGICRWKGVQEQQYQNMSKTILWG